MSTLSILKRSLSTSEHKQESILDLNALASSPGNQPSDDRNVILDIQGLEPNAEARAALQAGTCAMPSASFATLPDLQADAAGRATATGAVLFRGTENVALATMADGEHIIAIQAGRQVVACGVITKLPSASAPPLLPETGGRYAFTPAIAVGLGLCALYAGLFLWQWNRPR